MAQTIYKATLGLLKAVNRDERTITHVIHAKAVDRDGEVVLPSGGRFENYRKNPVVFLNHKAAELPVARNISIDRDGDVNVAVEQFAGLEQSHPAAEAAYKLAASGFLNAWSHGFVPLPGGTADPILPGQTGRTYTNWEELEISLVGLPSLREAVTIAGRKGLVSDQELDLLFKSAYEIPAADPKGAVPFAGHPLAPEGRAWDANGAVSRLRAWSGSADAPSARYRAGFAWYDAAADGNYGSYKLPHHDVAGGEMQTVMRGVMAAMGALLGARGGVSIPDGDRRGVYNHLARHLREFDREPPEFRAYEPAEWKEVEARLVATKGFSPAAFPIRESWEWTRNMLKATLPAYLAGQGVEVRPEKDMAQVAATFPDRAIVGVIGMDRPYEQDKTYQVGWTADESGVPGWTGTPEEIDVVTHAEIRPAAEAARVAAFRAEVKADPTSVQSVICSKERFRDAGAARSWASGHDFRTDKLDETGDSYRFRQFDPAQCQTGSFRTISLTDGVSAVICRRRTAERAAGTVGAGSDFLALEAVLEDFGDEAETKEVVAEFREALVDALGGMEKIGAELSAANIRALTAMCDEMDQHHKGHGGCIQRLKEFVDTRRREQHGRSAPDPEAIKQIADELKGLLASVKR